MINDTQHVCLRRGVANRHSEIITLLKRQGSMSVIEIAKKMGCSAATIRRDLIFLEKTLDNLKRFHGAVGIDHDAPNQTDSVPLPDEEFDDKITVNAAEKLAIAVKVAEFLPEHCVVGLNGGTTTALIAQQLVACKKTVTVVTNSVNIAYEMARSKISVVVVGGALQPANYETTGPLAMKLLEEFHLDWAVLGANAMDRRFGVSVVAENEAAVGRVFANRADSVIVAADHSKMGKGALFRMIDWREVDWVATSQFGLSKFEDTDEASENTSKTKAVLVRRQEFDALGYSNTHVGNRSAMSQKYS